jgi:hypothetical protein
LRQFDSLLNSSRDKWYRKRKSQGYSQESEQETRPTIAMERVSLDVIKIDIDDRVKPRMLSASLIVISGTYSLMKGKMIESSYQPLTKERD